MTMQAILSTSFHDDQDLVPAREIAPAPARDEVRFVKGLVPAGDLAVTRPLPGCAVTSAEARASFRGVALRRGEGWRLDVLLLGAQGQEPVLLERGVPYAEAVAVWRARAEALGLPALALHADGEVEVVRPAAGHLAVAKPSPRRRRPGLDGRRPRFLTRRKPGLPAREARAER